MSTKYKSSCNKSKCFANLDRRIRQIENEEELKYIDSFDTGFIPATGGAQQGAFFLLNPCVTGDLHNQRDGSEITMTSIQYRLHLVTGTGTNTDFPTEFRVMLILDRQADVTQPTFYTSGVGSGSMGVLDNVVATPIIHAPYNRSASEKYKILQDEIFILTSQFAGLEGAKFMTVHRKLGYKVKYTKTAGTGSISDIITNSLYFVVFNGSGNNNSSLTIGARVYFKDD